MLYILLFWVPHKLLKIKNLMFSRRLISWGFYILLISNLTVIGSLIWHQLSSFFQPAWSLNCQRSCITILEKKKKFKRVMRCVCIYNCQILNIHAFTFWNTKVWNFYNCFIVCNIWYKMHETVGTHSKLSAAYYNCVLWEDWCG